MRRNWKVGDRVRVRKWQDMAKQYGVPIEDPDIPVGIPTPAYFDPGMACLCGFTGTIRNIDEPSFGNDAKIELTLDDKYISDQQEEFDAWNWDSDMFERDIPSKYPTNRK